MVNPVTAAIMFWRWFWLGVLALVLLAALIVGGWQAGWWFTSQNNSREAHLIRNGYANQQTLRDQLVQQIANVDIETAQIAATSGAEQSALEAQRIAVVNIACGDASQITGDPLAADEAGWVSRNCLAGVIRPGSPFDTTGG